MLSNPFTLSFQKGVFFVNKRHSKFLALLLALAMVFAVMTSPSAYAANVGMAPTEVSTADVNLDPTALMVQAEAKADRVAPASYYPSDGVSSGVFHGKFSDPAIYTDMPPGTINFTYSFYGGSEAYVRFYQGWGTTGSYTQKGPYPAGNYTDQDSVLMGGETITVVIYNPHGSSTSELIYAFNLF